MGTETDMHRGKAGRDIEGTSCEDCSSVITSQGPSGATKSWTKQGMIFSYGFQWEHGPADTLIGDFQAPAL